jgi:hypothetical protein
MHARQALYHRATFQPLQFFLIKKRDAGTDDDKL